MEESSIRPVVGAHRGAPSKSSAIMPEHLCAGRANVSSARAVLGQQVPDRQFSSWAVNVAVLPLSIEGWSSHTPRSTSECDFNTLVCCVELQKSINKLLPFPFRIRWKDQNSVIQHPLNVILQAPLYWMFLFSFYLYWVTTWTPIFPDSFHTKLFTLLYVECPCI